MNKSSSRRLFVALAIAAVLSLTPAGTAQAECVYNCMEGIDYAICYQGSGDLSQCTPVCDCAWWSCGCWCRTQWCYWT